MANESLIIDEFIPLEMFQSYSWCDLLFVFLQGTPSPTEDTMSRKLPTVKLGFESAWLREK